jgi:predicted nucleotidyltransferase
LCAPSGEALPTGQDHPVWLHAYGTPHEDSDVDILVIMPERRQLSQAVRIELACERCFPLDLFVRTPKNIRWC